MNPNQPLELGPAMTNDNKLRTNVVHFISHSLPVAMSKEEAAAESPAAAPPVAEAPAATSPAAASPVATSPKATSPTVASPLASTPASPSPGVTAGVPLAAAGDPKVAELQSMFPTVDVGVIEMVLESVSGSQDRAIESLLQMTDPDFKPEETPAAGPENDVSKSVAI